MKGVQGCERSIFIGCTVILFTFVFGVLLSFKERITGFLFSFLVFSLSLAFSRVDSLLLVQVKLRVFGFLQDFITKIKGYARVKGRIKISNNNQQVKQRDIK